MNIKQIESLADDMVTVCVEQYGAKASIGSDDKPDLLWQYFRQMLVNTTNSVVSEVITKHHRVQRELGDLAMHENFQDSVDSLAKRMKALEEANEQ